MALVLVDDQARDHVGGGQRPGPKCRRYPGRVRYDLGVSVRVERRVAHYRYAMDFLAEPRRLKAEPRVLLGSDPLPVLLIGRGLVIDDFRVARLLIEPAIARACLLRLTRRIVRFVVATGCV